MQPPICELCGVDFREEAETGGLVRFADYRELPEGVTGHPRGTAWFCRRHLPAARRLSGLSQRTALGRLELRFFGRLWLTRWLDQR